MTYVIQAALVVAHVAALMYAGYRALEAEFSDESAKPWIAAVMLLLIAGLTLLLKTSADEEQTGPCVRYETRVIANGKTVQPYRVCVERGEWIDTKETR